MSAWEESAILILTTIVDAWKKEVPKGKTLELQETRVQTIFVTKRHLEGNYDRVSSRM